MKVPILITRSIMVLKERASTEKVSISFIARFSDGSEGILNITEWKVKGLRKESETGPDNATVLNLNTCPLYMRDWANVISGPNNFKTCYPSPPIVPGFVAEYMSI